MLCHDGAVAVVAHAVVDGMPWAAAFTLGAIVSPTDPIAASTIARRLGVGRRVVSIVEGESLINDGTALVAYKFAVAAVVTGAFSLAEASLEFVWNVVGGIAVGLDRRLRHPSGPQAHQPSADGDHDRAPQRLPRLPAGDALGVSGVLAAVVSGSTWAGTRRS